MRKEVEKIILEMTLWVKENEKLENEKMTPVSNMGDEFIFELNKILKATMVKKAPRSLREHASFKDYVLKQLHGYNYRFLGKDGRKNHHLIHNL